MAGMGIVLAVLFVLIALAACINARMSFWRVRSAVGRAARYLGWGTLLLPVALMYGQLLGFHTWMPEAIAAVGLLVVLLPAVAADLAALAVLLYGLYGLLLGTFGPSVAVSAHDWLGGLFYGTLVISSRWTAALAGLEGLALTGFARWLVPRSQTRHAPAAALARWVQGLARRCWPAVTGPALAGPDTGQRAALARAGRRRLDRLGWGAVLLPATLIFLPPYHSAAGFAAVLVLTAAVVFALPEVAARIAPLALSALGLLGIVIAVGWLQRVNRGPFEGLMYGTAYLDSARQAAVAGAEGAMLLGFGLWLAPLTLGGQVAALAGRVQRLAQTRTDAVDVAAAELRRVERDLHDGAQARLVALGMSLRAAERLIHSNPAAAGALVAEARDASSRALTDLRDLVRGIHPPVLADRGLRDAVRAIALDTPIRTELDIDLPGRLAAPVESAVYFAIAEALANVVKHAGARSVHIRMAHGDGMLRAEVTDDGTGGANPARGSGLRGIERRLGTFDGVLAVSSPPGGPTIVVIEVPCELSSPRTYSC